MRKKKECCCFVVVVILIIVLSYRNPHYQKSKSTHTHHTPKSCMKNFEFFEGVSPKNFVLFC